MAVQFNRSNPAISRFNAGMASGENTRAREEESFERRRGREQAQGVDRAVREGIGAFYAGQPPQPAGPAEPVAPPAQVTPPVQPDMSGMASPNIVPMAPQNVAGDPNELPGGGVMIAPPAAAAPASTAAPQPAIANVQARGGQGDPSRAMMQRLAATPGAGQAMLNMHTREQQTSAQNQRLRQQAEIQAIRSLHNGDPQIAEAIATHYGINIPKDVIRSATFQREMKNLGDHIKRMGIGDDATAVSITRAYLKARAGDADEQAALTSAFEGATAPAARPPKRRWDSVRGVYVEEPTEQSPQGRAIVPPSLPARQVVRSGGARATASSETGTQRNWATAANAYEEAGYDPKVARLMAVNPRFAVTPQLVQRQAQHIMSASKDWNKKSTVTYEDAMTRAQRMLANIRPGPAPGGESDPLGLRPPLSSFERSPGRIRFDALGNRIP